MNRIYKLPIAILVIALLFTSCVTKKYSTPDVKTDSLYRDMAQQDTTTLAAMPWDKLFADNKLNALIKKGLEQNVNLKNAIENIVQAQANLQQARLAYFPTLDATADIARTKQSVAALNLPPNININTLFTTYRGYFSSAWEADIWGKISSSKRVALANYLQTEAAKRAVQTQLIADIANNYYFLTALDEQLRITEITLENRINSVEIVKALKEAAYVTGADVVQAEANRYAAEVAIPDIKQNIRETENTLNILLSQPPGPIDRNTFEKYEAATDFSTGIPAQLLYYRPDVQQAELEFRASFENTNLARTYFYPRLTLTATGGLSTIQLQNFFDNSIFYSLIAGLTQPIFNQGVNKARLKVAKSQQVQALNDFQQTLFVAGQEVSNALYSYQMAYDKRQSRAKQIEALEKAVEFTEELLKYTSNTNYTDVLTSQQSLLTAQLSGIDDKLQQLQAIVNLHRALGGGWQ